MKPLPEGAGSPISRMPQQQKAGYGQHTSPKKNRNNKKILRGKKTTSLCSQIRDSQQQNFNNENQSADRDQ